jgi:hypothetical protein
MDEVSCLPHLIRSMGNQPNPGLAADRLPDPLELNLLYKHRMRIKKIHLLLSFRSQL